MGAEEQVRKAGEEVHSTKLWIADQEMGPFDAMKQKWGFHAVQMGANAAKVCRYHQTSGLKAGPAMFVSQANKEVMRQSAF
jgi:hypothetical protein